MSWSALMWWASSPVSQWMKPFSHLQSTTAGQDARIMDKHPLSGTLPTCGTVLKVHLLSVWWILLWAGVRGSNGLTHCGEHLHGRPGDACLEDVPLQVQDVVQVRRCCLCHQASWRSSPGDLPAAPQRTKPLPFNSPWKGSWKAGSPSLTSRWRGEELQPWPLSSRKRHTLTGTWTTTHITLPRYSEESCSAWRSGQWRYVMGVSEGRRSNTSDKCSGPMAILNL